MGSDPVFMPHSLLHYPQSITNLSVINERSILEESGLLDQTFIEDENQEEKAAEDEGKTKVSRTEQAYADAFAELGE